MRRALGRERRPAGTLAAALLIAGALLAGCSSSSPDSAAGGPPSTTAGSSPTAPTTLPPETLTFGVFGNADEVAAYQQMTKLFAPLSRQVTVKVESWPDHTSMLDAIQQGAAVPDVFIASRSDLAWLQQHQVVQPVDGMLDDRGVDFGDDYPRDALTAFAGNNHLTCLPYGISPEVIFYNKALVRFDHMHFDPPTPGQGWSLQQFKNSARWAMRHHAGTSGFYVDPTLQGLSPFLYSGGGQVFDNQTQPTSTAFSSSASLAALRRSLGVLGRKDLTLTPQQLLAKTPLEWFQAGKLAMIEGDRSLVPRLRSVLGLNFDVMPIPSVSAPKTVAGMTGLCVSANATDAATAADFVAYASSPDALGEVAAAGYLQPANQTVALSAAFQQPGHLPQHSSVFTFAVKSAVIPPLLLHQDELEQRLDPLVAQLFSQPTDRIGALADQIDRTSHPYLAVPTTSASPAASPSS